MSSSSIKSKTDLKLSPEIFLFIIVIGILSVGDMMAGNYLFITEIVNTIIGIIIAFSFRFYRSKINELKEINNEQRRQLIALDIMKENTKIKELIEEVAKDGSD